METQQQKQQIRTSFTTSTPTPLLQSSNSFSISPQTSSFSSSPVSRSFIRFPAKIAKNCQFIRIPSPASMTNSNSSFTTMTDQSSNYSGSSIINDAMIVADINDEETLF